MPRLSRRWTFVGAAALLLAVGAPVMAATADEVPPFRNSQPKLPAELPTYVDEMTWTRVRLHWYINLLDVGNKSCTQSSTQQAYIAPDDNSTVVHEMEAPNWKQRCGDAWSRVRSTARWQDDGRVEINIHLDAIKDGVTWEQNDGKIYVKPDTGIQETDIKLDASSEATAFGTFVGSAVSIGDRETGYFEYRKDLDSNDVNGYASLQVWRTGQFIFSGHLHNSGDTSKDVKVTCAMNTGDGRMFSFEAAGDLNGLLTAIDSDKKLDWRTTGTNGQINTAFVNGQVTQDAPYDCMLSVETDTSDDILGGVLVVLKIGKAIFDFLT